MIRRLARLPMPLLLAGAFAVAMLIPAVFAVAHGEHVAARAFFYSALLELVVCLFAAIAVGRFAPAHPAEFHLVSLAASFSVLPLALGLPVMASVGGSWLTMWFDMVASITTTGASAYPPGSLPDSVQLWRGIVAWMGGLMVWVAAAAVLTPLNLGGEELITRGAVTAEQHRQLRELPGQHHNSLILRHLRLLFPVYALVTVALWGVLVSLGEHAFPALMRAMATISTSGILAEAPGQPPASGMAGELAVAAFLMLAVSQRLFRPEGMRTRI
ncbi:MAG: TrkH family potassium uptake protein, partial [Alphaproteobacteria bacterium]